jgi:myxalamid-type polyketide synthase MxaF
MKSEAAIRDWLIEIFCNLLNIDRNELNAGERFKNYGLDSATAVKVTSTLSKELARPLEQTLLWDYPNINALAAYLANGHTKTEARTSQPAAATAVQDNEPIAIIGISCRFPGAENKTKFWELLSNGVSAVTEVPADRWATNDYFNADSQAPGTLSTKWGAFIADIDKFDPGFFAISPREAIQMDPQQRIMMELSWQALQDGGIIPEDLKGSSTGVFFGAIWNDYLLLNKQEGLNCITQHTATGTHHSIIANRVSYAFGLQGASLCIDSACSSSLVAVHLAAASLRSGESSLALAGGINLMIGPDSTIALSKFGAMAPDGRCKAFDAAANGYVRGEGAGVIVLKRLSDALAAGDRIYCVIAGSAVNNDGPSNGLTAPNPKAQEDVLTTAYRKAGVDPNSVRYVETHGTGTFLGDPIEAKAIGKILSSNRQEQSPLYLGSVKTNIGHLEAAAGIAGLIKAALSVHNRSIPANLNFSNPNENIPFKQYKLQVPQQMQHWQDNETAVAGVSSFGFGGTNCHVVLKELPVQKPQVLVLGDDDLYGLKEQVEQALGNADYELSVPADGLARLAVVATDDAAMQKQLQAFLDGLTAPGIFYNAGTTRPKPVAFVCSGHGSQYPAMAKALLAEPVFRARLQEIDKYFQPLSGWSIIDEINVSRDVKRLEQLEVAQPLIFSVQAGLAALLDSWGIRPDVIVAHSLGEVTGAYIAGILDTDEAVSVIYNRSRLMGTLAGKGTMAVVGLDREQAAVYLRDYPGLCVAVINSPGAVVVSGNVEEIRSLMSVLESKNIFNKEVQVNVAGHSSQMAPLGNELYESVKHIFPKPGRCPLVSSVYGSVVPYELFDAGYWVRNINQPVLFLDAMKYLLQQDDHLVVELSPHPILKKSIEETAASLKKHLTVIPTMERDEPPALSLMNACAALYAHGHQPHWQKINGHTATVRGDLHDGGSAGTQLFTLSAHTSESLSQLLNETIALLKQNEIPFSDLIYTAALKRSHQPYRLAALAASPAKLLQNLEAFAAQEYHASVFKGGSGRQRTSRTVFVFSGQGAQWLGMGTGLFRHQPVFRKKIGECDAVMAALGLHSWTLAQQLAETQDENMLHQTEIIQPLIFSIQVALAELWKSWGIAPAAVVGHSLGEIAAAYVAGVLSLEDAMRLVCHRGKYCQSLRGKGAMASLELRADQVEELLLLDEYKEALQVAALNSLGSTVVSGDRPAIDSLMQRLSTEGVKARIISEHYAFHSRQTETIIPDFIRSLRTLKTAPSAIPFYSTVAGAIKEGYELDSHYWVSNLRDKVRFSEAISSLLQGGFTDFLEIGPHSSLSLPISQLLDQSGKKGMVLSSLVRKQDEISTIFRSLAGLYVQGADVNWKAVYRDGGALTDLPVYPFRRERYWLASGKLQLPAKNSAYPLPGKKLSYPGKGANISFQAFAEAAEYDMFTSGTGQEIKSMHLPLLLEMVLTAGRKALATQSIQVSEIAMEAAITQFFPARQMIQLDLLPVQEGFSFQLHAYHPAADEWELLASGKIKQRMPGPLRNGTSVPQVVGANNTLVRLKEASPAHEVCLHPVLVHEVLAFAGNGIAPNLLPVSFKEAVFMLPLSRSCSFHAFNLRYSEAGIAANIALYTEEGELACMLKEVQYIFTEENNDEASPGNVPGEALSDLLYEPQWNEKTSHEPTSGPEGDALWMVFLSESGPGQAFAAHLSAAGKEYIAVLASDRYEVVSEKCYLLDPARPEHYTQLFAQVQEDLAPQNLRLAYFWLCDLNADLPGPPAMLQLINSSMHHLLTLVRQWKLSEHAQTDLSIITKQAHRIVDTDALNVQLAPACALANVIRVEHPDIECRSMDTDLQPSSLAALFEDLAQQGHEQESAYRNGRRYVHRLRKLSPAKIQKNNNASIRPDRTYLVTGGFGDLGLAVAELLVMKGAVHIALLGRKGGEAVQPQLQKLEEKGAIIRQLKADIADYAALEKSLQSLEVPLGGIIHAAGVMDKSLTDDMTMERAQSVLLPKVQGTWNLHLLTEKAPLDFFIGFSSISALLGFRELASYCAANAFIDAAMQYRQSRGLAGLSLNWGPIEAGMMMDAKNFVKTDMERAGLFPIHVSKAMRLLELFLFSNSGQATIVSADWLKLHNGFRHGSPFLSKLQKQGRHVQQGPVKSSREDVSTILRQMVGDILDTREPDFNKSLQELGMSSLMVVELIDLILKRIHLSVSPAVVYNTSSVHELADKLFNSIHKKPQYEISS